MLSGQLQRKSDVKSTELPDGGSVLLDLSSELYFGLNAVGTKVWSYIGDGSSASEIVDRLDAEYTDVERATLEGDVTALVAELYERSLLIDPASTS